jgi:hypothetical protein
MLSVVPLGIESLYHTVHSCRRRHSAVSSLSVSAVVQWRVVWGERMTWQCTAWYSRSDNMYITDLQQYSY